MGDTGMPEKTKQGATKKKTSDTALETVQPDSIKEETLESPEGSKTSTDVTNCTILTEQWQRDASEKARQYGFIALRYLGYILASDNQYEKLLETLWENYQLDRRGPKKLNELSNPKVRIGIWQALLKRWAFGMVAGIREGLDDMPYLTVYSFDKITGQLAPYDRARMIGVAYVKLDELGDYFAKMKPPIPLPSLLYPKLEEEGKNIDEFVKSLRVEVENDSEITIQEPRKSKVTYHCSKMGFKNERVKTWELLLETLRKKSHIIKLPPRSNSKGGRNKEYDSKRSILIRLNKAFVEFLRKEFELDIPSDYKIYFPYTSNGVGSFAFKFKVPDAHTNDRYETMEKDKLLNKIELLADKYSDTSNKEILSELGELLSLAKNREWITADRVRELLES